MLFFILVIFDVIFKGPEVTNNDDDDFESREELIEEVNKLLFALEPQTTCPLESEDIDARDRQLTEDFIDELFKATLEAEKVRSSPP